MANVLICPKCKSNNINVQLVQGKTTSHTRGLNSNERDANRFMRLITLGMVGRKTSKTKTKTKNDKIAVCSTCGYDWKIK